MQLRHILYATALIRALSTSAIGVFLGLDLAQRGITPAAVGAIVSAGLAGTALAAAIATLLGDRIGIRVFLGSLTGLGVLGIAGLWAFDTPLPLAAAAFVGMANGMGRDRGAALILEQAALPATTTDRDRTRIFAWYSMLQDIGHAVGALVPTFFSAIHGPQDMGASRTSTLGALGFLGLISVALYTQLRGPIGALAPSKRTQISPRSRRILVRICSLFAIDSLAGGFLTTALLSYFFFERFGVGAAVIGPLFFGARLMNAVSHLAAAFLAQRIGLVNTMVFTHIPSSLLLVTVAFAPTLPIAIVLFLLREGLVEMDVPTRQSYVLAVVEPAERTFASGVTNLVRLGAWAVAPVVAGSLLEPDSLYLPLVIGAGMKIAYDILLWRAFRAIRPPEELVMLRR